MQKGKLSPHASIAGSGYDRGTDYVGVVLLRHIMSTGRHGVMHIPVLALAMGIFISNWYGRYSHQQKKKQLQKKDQYVLNHLALASSLGLRILGFLVADTVRMTAGADSVRPISIAIAKGNFFKGEDYADGLNCGHDAVSDSTNYKLRRRLTRVVDKTSPVAILLR
jgi:hypothetical protein